MPQARANCALFNNLHRCGQRTGPQNDGQVVGFLSVKITGNPGGTAGNPLLDNRGGIDLVIQHNGQPPLDVLPGDTFKNPGAFAVKLNGDKRLVELLIDLNPGIGQMGAGQQGLFFNEIRLRLSVGAGLAGFGRLVEDLASRRDIAV